MTEGSEWKVDRTVCYANSDSPLIVKTQILRRWTECYEWIRGIVLSTRQSSPAVGIEDSNCRKFDETIGKFNRSSQDREERHRVASGSGNHNNPRFVITQGKQTRDVQLGTFTLLARLGFGVKLLTWNLRSNFSELRSDFQRGSHELRLCITNRIELSHGLRSFCRASFNYDSN